MGVRESGGRLGRVVVQTFNPDRAPILFAQKHDFKAFYEDEIRLRRADGSAQSRSYRNAADQEGSARP